MNMRNKPAGQGAKARPAGGRPQHKNRGPRKPNPQKAKKILQANAGLEWLKQNFPKVFANDPKNIKPLKIGIAQDIFAELDKFEEPPISRKQCRLALRYYANQVDYIKTILVPGNYRIDLEGNKVGMVSEKEAGSLKAKLIKQLNQKKQQQKGPRRDFKGRDSRARDTSGRDNRGRDRQERTQQSQATSPRQDSSSTKQD